MFREFHILLDAPPNSVFTYEDTVSGKVVLESPRDEAVGWIHVFFHGWVSTEVVIQNSYAQSQGGPNQSKYKDKEVLFQYCKNVYRGQEHLRKNTRYEWPFQFTIETESRDGSSLPSSGEYYNSSVEYKVIAVQGRIGQSDKHILSMMNPEDPLFLKEAPFSPTAIFLWAGKHVGGTADEKLVFCQIRPPGNIDPSLSPPVFGKHEISSSHLPEVQQSLAASPQKHGLFHGQHHEHIPFEVNLQVARNIVEGWPFPMLLSISSLMAVWNHNPPPVTLVSFKMHLLAKTIERASHHHSEQSYKLRTFKHTDLRIPLGEAQVDIAQLIPLVLAGNDIIPSFGTLLLQRKYDISAEVTVEVAGKSFHSPFLVEDSITIFSRLITSAGSRMPLPAGSHTPLPAVPRERAGPRTPLPALPQESAGPRVPLQTPLQEFAGPRAHPPAPLQESAGSRAPLPPLLQESTVLREDLATVKLKHCYIGRLTQDGGGDIRTDIIMEAAITLSKLLTIAGVQHSFPKGPLVKLHAYKPESRHAKTTYWDEVEDREKLVPKLTQTGQFRVLPSQNVPGLTLGFLDALGGENVGVDFPHFYPTSESFQDEHARETRGPTDGVKLDPVSLFNYRLWCAAARERLSEAEIEDFGMLQKAFGHELHSHRKHIDVSSAMIALERYPSLNPTLKSIGLDIDPGKGPSLMHKGQQSEPQAHGHRVHDVEQDLVQGLKRTFLHKRHLKDSD